MIPSGSAALGESDSNVVIATLEPAIVGMADTSAAPNCILFQASH
jgi:hypothetical protein